MGEFLEVIGWIVLGMIVGAVVVVVALKRIRWRDADGSTLISTLIQSHFHPTPITDITIAERQFPFRVRAVGRCADRIADHHSPHQPHAVPAGAVCGDGVSAAEPAA